MSSSSKSVIHRGNHWAYSRLLALWFPLRLTKVYFSLWLLHWNFCLQRNHFPEILFRSYQVMAAYVVSCVQVCAGNWLYKCFYSYRDVFLFLAYQKGSRPPRVFAMGSNSPSIRTTRNIWAHRYQPTYPCTILRAQVWCWVESAIWNISKNFQHFCCRDQLRRIGTGNGSCVADAYATAAWDGFCFRESKNTVP